MKKRSVSTLGVCLASVLGLAMAINPTSAAAAEVLKVTLPYATTVGTTTLPAGELTITDVKDDGNASILVIRSTSGVSVEVLVGRIDTPHSRLSDQTQVVFRHTGSTYQMDKIWLAGRSYGYEFAPVTAHD